MLSERERQWLWLGGTGAFCLLYLWLVLFPLIGYHQKMRGRIERSWSKIHRLESVLGDYARASWKVRELIRRATAADQKIPAGEQLKALVRQMAGEQASGSPMRFESVWEGEGFTMKRCFLQLEVTPAQAFQLIQRIDHHYLPMRVVRWDLKRKTGGVYTLKMEIDLLEAGGKS